MQHEWLPHPSRFEVVTKLLFRAINLSCRAKNEQRDSDARSQSKHPYPLLNSYQTREGDQPETRLPHPSRFSKAGISGPNS
jgi:hypothetical protein